MPWRDQNRNKAVDHVQYENNIDRERERKAKHDSDRKRDREKEQTVPAQLNIAAR